MTFKITLQQLKFYYKYLHNDLPRYLQNWRFVFKYEVHGHDTRDKNKKYTFKETLISHSTQGFAKYVKLIFLQSYQVACTIQDCYVCMQH